MSTIKEQIIKLHEEGYTIRRILDTVKGQWDSNVRNIIKNYKLQKELSELKK